MHLRSRHFGASLPDVAIVDMRTAPLERGAFLSGPLRKALADSTATSGYKVALERLKIHSVQIQGDGLVVDVDGDISVQ